MSDKNSLNEKYQKFEAEEPSEQVSQEKPSKNKKEKKVKEPKAPKEKKVKEPKAPKEKKVKEPKAPKEKKVKEPKAPKEKKIKEPKAPKEKKVKEPKAPKEKKVKEPKAPKEKKVKKSEEIKIENAVETKPFAVEKEKNTETEEKVEVREVSNAEQDGRQREEIVFSADNSDKKKSKKKKAPKDKKAKEPKQKKDKKVKETKEKKPHDPLQKKDFATIIIGVVAVLLATSVGFYAYFYTRPVDEKVKIVSKITFLGKIFPEYVVNDNTEKPGDKGTLSNIQTAREGILVNLIPTDFPRVFYGITSDYTVRYYQYSNSKMMPVKYTDSINLKVDMGSGILNVKMNYIKNGEYVSGIGLYTADSETDSTYFYDFVLFKLTVLPSKYRKEGHALLLATTDKTALEKEDVIWTESFDVNLNDGTMTRFLSVVNRNIDEKGAGVADFCMLNKAGYTSTAQKIPFISSREYPIGAGMQDIFVKNGAKDELFASNVYGKFVTLGSSETVYLRKTATGFDVIHNINGEEKNVRSFYGFMETNYMINDKYILSKADGHLYNIVTDKDYSLVGYAMNVASFIVSDDERYVIMMGTVKNAVDYQIHVFDLKTGEYAKFQDKNYAPHGTLCFIDDKTVLYTAIDPNQGYEYVVLDFKKAFEKSK